MRLALVDPHRQRLAEHLGLAYGAWTPAEAWSKNGEARSQWLARVSKESVIAPDYALAFERWKDSFADQGDRLAALVLQERLLIGHGNASPTGVGLTVHHTWGVPILPGSALKGLLAHYLDACFGPDEMRPPWEYQNEDRARASFMGISWNEGNRPERGPGDVYRLLFGAPDAEQDKIMCAHGYAAGAAGGMVTFHDALYVPNSAPQNRPYALDVLTPHQSAYCGGGGEVWPSDYDDPIPVSFLSICPNVTFQLALSGPLEWTTLAADLLSLALREWGVGGKTAAGYGHGMVGPWRSPEAPPGEAITAMLAWLKVHPTDGQIYTQRHLLADIKGTWSAALATMSDTDLWRAADAIGGTIRSPKLRAERDAFLASCRSNPKT